MNKETVRDGFAVGGDGAASEIFGSSSMPGTPEYAEPSEDNPLSAVERLVTSAISEVQDLLRTILGEEEEPEPTAQRDTTPYSRPAEKPANSWPAPTATTEADHLKSPLEEAHDRFNGSEPSLEELVVYKQLNEHDNPRLIELFIEEHESHLSPALVELLQLSAEDIRTRHDEDHRKNIFE